MRTVVVGGGIMGGGIALALARAGHLVTVVEPDVRSGERLAARLARDESPIARAAEVSADLERAAVADLVIEATPEDLAVKLSVWRRLGGIAPTEAILATNTSSLDVDLLAEQVPAPSRVLATHWFNPAYEIPCVEVAAGRATDPRVLARALEVLRAAGKSPVVVPNIPGFVANRIQFAAIREALLCVAEGIPAEDVDEIVRTSFAPRLAALGPLANADLGGLDTYAAIFAVLQAAHGDRFSSPALLEERVAAGRLGVKSGMGISRYSDAQARALAETRDDRLRRLLAAQAAEER